MGAEFAGRAGGMLAMRARDRIPSEFNAILRIKRRCVVAEE